MKKLFSLIGLLAFAGAVYADDEDSNVTKTKKSISVGISFGLVPDAAALTETITKDGTLDVADGNMMKEVYSSGQVFMSDRNNMILKHSSANTNSAVKVLDKFTSGGGMVAGEYGFQAQYEDRAWDVPIFLRTGFNYSSVLSASAQERTLGDISSRNGSVASLLRANGLNPSDFSGGTMKTTWDASWYEIPITLGFRIPVTQRTSAYAGMGISIFQGGFGLNVDVDEKYANVLSTYIDANAATATNYNKTKGNIKQQIDFNAAGIGLNWVFGLQTQIHKNGALFLELNASGMAKTVYNSKLDEKTQRLLTATQSETLASGTDNQWFKRLAFPVVMRGASVRMGYKHFFDL